VGLRRPTVEPYRLIWDDRFLEYDFGPTHPFQQRYRALAVELFSADRKERDRGLRILEEVEVAPRTELLRFHSAAYVDRVERAGHRVRPGFLDQGDTPGFTGCHEASARIVGGAIAGVELLLTERSTQRVIHPGGGLHHAAPGAASGFCIYNDVAIALARALEGPDRVDHVAYIDIDAHHGDGVMYGFYRDGRVLDIDFHQDGRTLFPGTGAVDESGRSDGEGWKFNIPMPPGTGDLEFVPLFQRIVPTMLDAHRPGLIVLQHGMDGHAGDPLAALQLGPSGYVTAVTTLRDWADAHGVPFLVSGGGGYRPEHVARGLARAMTLLDDPAAVPAGDTPVPSAWRSLFVDATGRPAPTHWADGPPAGPSRSLPPWAEAVLGELRRTSGRPL
jgi:acetoin utilization protein AcuC